MSLPRKRESSTVDFLDSRPPDGRAGFRRNEAKRCPLGAASIQYDDLNF